MPLCTDKEVVIDSAVAVENLTKMYLFTANGQITVVKCSPQCSQRMQNNTETIENSSQIDDYFSGFKDNQKSKLKNRPVKAAYTQERGSLLILETDSDDKNQRVRIYTKFSLVFHNLNQF